MLNKRGAITQSVSTIVVIIIILFLLTGLLILVRNFWKESENLLSVAGQNPPEFTVSEETPDSIPEEHIIGIILVLTLRKPIKKQIRQKTLLRKKRNS